MKEIYEKTIELLKDDGQENNNITFIKNLFKNISASFKREEKIGCK